MRVYKRCSKTGRRVEDNEPGTWTVAVSWNGKRKRKACPEVTSKTKAEAIARSMLYEMQTGEATRQEEQKETRRTIQKLTDQIASLQRQLESKDSNKGERTEIEFTRFRDHVWLSHKKARNKNTYDIYANMAPIYDDFKDRMIHTITKPDIQDWLRKRVETKTRTGAARSHATLNRELSVLGGLFKVAVKQGYIKRNPCHGIEQFPDDGGRILIIEEDDEKIIMAAFTGPLEKYKAVFIIALHTGMRLTELTENFLWENINWSDDPEKRSVTVYGKGGKWRMIPLNDSAYEVLKELRAEGKGKGRVFSGPGFTRMHICHQVAKVCDDVGLPDITLHSCRHTFITRLLENGANLEQARVLAGHSKITTTQRYAHLARSRSLHRAVQTLVPSAPSEAMKRPSEIGKRHNDGTVTEQAEMDAIC